MAPTILPTARDAAAAVDMQMDGEPRSAAAMDESPDVSVVDGSVVHVDGSMDVDHNIEVVNSAHPINGYIIPPGIRPDRTTNANMAAGDSNDNDESTADERGPVKVPKYK